MKRVLTALLALCLLLGVPAAAVSQDRLSLTYQDRDGEVRLTLEGLEGEAYALQVELSLEGNYPDARFTPASSDVYAPECRVEADRESTVVTVYLVAEGESLRGRTLTLGTLRPRGDGYRLPARAELLALDRDGQPIYDGRVSLTSERGGTSDQGGSASSGGAEERSRVHIAEMAHGAVTVRPAGAREGETVLLNVSPDAGYLLDTITARDSRDRDVSLTRDTLGRYTFTMPSLEVEVTASFIPSGGEGEPRFQDVTPGAWCYDAVRYVYQAGLMNGTSETAFTPDTPTTRGQIVAILYRLEGSPAAGTAPFRDVAPTSYYNAAVSWASSNGIVNGYNDGTFRPNDLITREQLAAFFYRYASQKGRDVSEETELNVFTDAGEIASYAAEPLRWALAKGVMNGTAVNVLSPKGNASRAQVAVTLTRFIQNVY